MSRGVCPGVISERGGCALYIPVIFRHGLDGVGVAVGWVEKCQPMDNSDTAW